MKICAHCKTENNDTANFCRQCGFVFPEFSSQGKAVDISLLDRVNDMQQQVSEMETKLQKAEREKKTLDSQVNSLVADRSRFEDRCNKAERDLSYSQSALATERNNVQKLKTDLDDAIKEKDDVESSKGTIHLFYIALVAISLILAAVQCSGKNDTASKLQDVDSKLTTTQRELSKIKEENIKLANVNNTLSATLEEVGTKAPLIVGNITVKNEGESYGATIYSANTTFINPKIELFSLIEGNVEIGVKLYTPFGLSTGDSSPSGYSYKHTIYVSKNQQKTYELMGWGNSQKGNWPSGWYRYEIYYKGQCIGSHRFMIN